MSSISAATEGLHLVGTQADLQFLVPQAGKPRTYTYDPPPGERRSNARYAPHRVPIHDARRDAASFALDREGFAFVRHASAVQDFWDEDEVRRVYYSEAERLIGDATGADRVFVFDHTLRRRVPDADDRAAGLPRQPATRVHVDRTLKSGPQRVRNLLPHEAETLLRGRVQIINLWRPIVGPLWDNPLALCDARRVDIEDLVASDLIFPDRVGETYAVTYNPAQRWSYIPRHDARRGAADQVLRQRRRLPRPLRPAQRLHRSRRTWGRAAPREHRNVDAGFPRGLEGRGMTLHITSMIWGHSTSDLQAVRLSSGDFASLWR